MYNVRVFLFTAVFLCFALLIIKTKATYYTDSSECYSIDVITDASLCRFRSSHLLWSVPVAWAGLSCLLILFGLWILMSRVVRFDKLKASQL